ncbi:MAG: prepilin-type N-terminal cleavage/methylation domain-containing protein [Alphaproteobacteria bacterium]|nr:MAG: prepilin-type N-terminal cleavage/methylation domain-containing protein [Alphaproteobacteria bacterium]
MRPQPATVEDGMPADCMVRPRGFTLVEVIVAFVIAALALAAVYAAFSLGFAASEKAEDALRRQMVA